MKAKIAYSQKQDILEIVSDIKGQLGSFDAKMVQFYSSSSIDPDALSAQMQLAFGNTPTFGCTTSGEIVSGLMLDSSVVVMALGAGIVNNCRVEVISNIKSDSSAVDTAFIAFEDYFGVKMTNLDHEKYIGIVLIDGLSGKEEVINERIGDLTNIAFVGGSAGDDLKFEQTYVFANGNAYSNAAVLVIIESNTAFNVLKTQSFKATGKTIVASKVDEPNRTIIEMNGRPATEEYARLLGIEQDNVSKAFPTNPVGLVFEDDFFVRSPQKANGTSIVFYCSVKEGMELSILQSTSIVEETQKALESMINALGGVSAVVNFNCILRTLELKEKKKTEDYGRIFTDIPTVGFSTYGESYIGHINQTATMLIFK